jgi:hypothetical protein
MSKDFTATITNPKRAADWLDTIGTVTVHIKSPVPQRGSFPGIGEAEFYELDLDLLTEDQRARLIAHTAKRFNVPLEEVAAGLEEHGMPILAKDCSIGVRNPQKWF